MTQAVSQLDLHGKNVYQARVTIDAALRRAKGICRLRLIHGCHGGTAIRDMIFEEYADHPAVKRLQRIDGATTDLILREF